jgi:tRNA pseudouridine38-40 synthase
MPERVIQLVLQYDGSDFSGWQVQPAARTVQGVVEDALADLAGQPVRVTGAGRTDAGVHARGQAAGVAVAAHWTPDRLRRALNQRLPNDVWIADAHEMVPTFHARFGATARRYSYSVALGRDARSPFRRRFRLPWDGPAPDTEALAWCAAQVVGTHRFRAFAVRGTAPEHDDHACTVRRCAWTVSAEELVLDIEANRFLHHMVRFLVGTMMDVATGRRPREDFPALLRADHNDDVSEPAPACGLVLEQVTYPDALYLGT